MSKFKGTKGKWEIKKWSVVSDNKEICELKQITFGLGLGGITKRDFEAEANAKLIAAAPDLLKSIECYFEALKEVMGEDWAEYPHEALQKMLNAVSKATE